MVAYPLLIEINNVFWHKRPFDRDYHFSFTGRTSKFISVKKFIFSNFGISVALIFSVLPAEASLNSPINLENPRVVPIFGQQNSSQIADRAG